MAEEAKCPICLSSVTNRVVLECGHNYCNGCMISWISSGVQDGKLIFVCVLCKVSISPIIIESFMTPETLIKYDKFQLDKVLDQELALFYCPNTSCKGVVEVHDQKSVYVKCPYCTKEYCFQCKVPWHKDITCKKYQDDSGIFQTIKALNAKQCPKCKYWIEKNEGCDHMTCVKCKYEFWWTTLEHYPEGKTTLHWDDQDIIPQDALYQPRRVILPPNLTAQFTKAVISQGTAIGVCVDRFSLVKCTCSKGHPCSISLFNLERGCPLCVVCKLEARTLGSYNTS